MPKPHRDPRNPRAGALLVALLVILGAPDAGAVVPSQFDWRTDFGANCVSGVRNTLSCSADFIFAPVAMVEARQMIAAAFGGHPVDEIDYSEQYILACGTGYYGDFNCASGGYCRDVLVHLRDVGAPLESCYTYQAADAVCPVNCPDTGAPLVLFAPVVAIGEHSSYPGEAELMQEIYDHGPVAITMEVYEDLYAYSSGVYRHITGSYQGGHAVVVVGWGSDGATGYWIVKNSWGTWWGDEGYFLVARADQANCAFANWSWTCAVEAPAVSAVTPAPVASDLLAQNYPNPFNPTTVIRYRVPADGPVTLRVHDAAGRQVATLVDGVQVAGRDHEAVWNSCDGHGRRVAGGVYFYRLEVAGEAASRRMVLLK